MIIELLNGTRYDIADYDLKRLFHYIPSAEITHSTSSVEGRPDIITDSQLNNRIISVELLYKSQDIYDYYLLRDEINALFMRTEAFYIIFKREPYKRWLVKTSKQFEVPPHPRMGSFKVEFVTQKGYAESIATTADLKEWDVDEWGWNNTIEWDEELKYTFNQNTFALHNLGNVAIDPRQHELQIVVNATANNLRIRNLTTGDAYEFNAPLSSTDTLIVEGIRTFKNGVSAFKHTNKQLLTLAAGTNDFVIEGGTIHNIAFNFRFLFK